MGQELPEPSIFVFFYQIKKTSLFSEVWAALGGFGPPA